MNRYQMLRKQRQMSPEDAEDLLSESAVGRLAMCHDNEPYVIPMLFYYNRKEAEIFLHCAMKGRKIEAIESNSNVCFEIDEMKSIVLADVPCEFDLIYRSVIVTGRAMLLDEPEMKAKALNMIFGKYVTGSKRMIIGADMAKGTQLIRIEISGITGKEAKGTTIPYP